MTDDDRDRLRRGRPADYPRAKSAPIPQPIGPEDSIPVLMQPGMPEPSRTSRVRPYYTPEDYAEADHRRMERIVSSQVAPIGSRLDEHINWVRQHEMMKANQRAEDHQQIVKIGGEVSSLKLDVALVKRDVTTLNTAETGRTDIKKRRLSTVETVVITALITFAIQYLLHRGGV